MSLKCSVFGHRFGDPVAERARDESGSEVVITIQEVQTCDRCGHERVVSENKEVTTLETPEEPADTAGDRSAESSEPAGDTSSADEPPVQEAEPAAATTGSTPDLGAVDEEPDDGVILEADEPADDEADRDPGAWPEEPGDDGPEWAPPTDVDDAADPAPDPGPSVEPTGEALTVPEGRFRCPSCGFTTPVAASSLREGDFCPECHTGSLAHERGAE